MSFCPNENCQNYGRLPLSWPNDLYSRSNIKDDGKQRLNCKACERSFLSFQPEILDKNIRIAVLRFLTGGSGLDVICQKLNLSHTAIADHIEKIDTKLQAFEDSKTAVADMIGTKVVSDDQGILQFNILEDADYIIGINQPIKAPAKDSTAGVEQFQDSSSFKRILLKSKNQISASDKEQDIAKILNIHRIWTNFKVKGKDGKTPSMRIGFSEAAIDLETVIF